MFQKVNKECPEELTEQMNYTKQRLINEPWFKGIGWHGNSILIYIIQTEFNDNGKKLIQEIMENHPYEIMGFGKKRVFYG